MRPAHWIGLLGKRAFTWSWRGDGNTLVFTFFTSGRSFMSALLLNEVLGTGSVVARVLKPSRAASAFSRTLVQWCSNPTRAILRVRIEGIFWVRRCAHSVSWMQSPRKTTSSLKRAAYWAVTCAERSTGSSSHVGCRPPSLECESGGVRGNHILVYRKIFVHVTIGVNSSFKRGGGTWTIMAKELGRGGA